MNTRILLFLFIGGLLAVQTEEKITSDGQQHQLRDFKDDIFIDEMQADPAERGAAGPDLDEEASGIGPDDEDTFEGSGGVEGSGERGRTITKDPEPPAVYPITPAPTKKTEIKPTLPEVPEVVKVTTTTKPSTEPTTSPSPPEISTHKNEIPERPSPPGRKPTNNFDNNINVMSRTPEGTPEERPTTSFFSQPGILAAIIGGAVVGLLCAILLVMFIVYRMRKKDEGSYVLDEPRRSPRNASYHPANKDSKEFFA